MEILVKHGFFMGQRYLNVPAMRRQKQRGKINVNVSLQLAYSVVTNRGSYVIEKHLL